MFSHLTILLQISARNILASKVNVIVGFIMCIGTFLALVGSSFIESIDRAMTRSLQHSVAGHIQVYSSKSKEELALFGSFGGDSNIAPITDYSKMRAALEKHPNVEKIVPMGVRGALITSGNIIDVTLSRLRAAYRVKRDGVAITREMGLSSSAPLDEQISAMREHVRQMVTVLKSDLQRLAALVDEKGVNRDDVEAIERASSEEFWAGFDQDPYEHLEFLENRVAPIMSDGDLLWLLYVGTDLDTFQDAFDRMEIVEGQKVPRGQRGFLVSKFVMEEYFKLKTARRLDLIKEGIELKKKDLDKDPDLQRMVKMNATQTREIVLQLDRLKTENLRQKLQRVLGSGEADVAKLLATFFTMSGENFQQRYKFFYDDVAPMLQLYRIKIGDTLTITAFTTSGYMQSVNVPIYGTVQFKGLEKSFVSGSMNLMDLMSFRDLYGYLTPEKKAELAKLKAESGAREIARDRAEEELFGSGDNIVAEATPGVIADDERLQPGGLADKLRREDLIRRVYSREEIDQGMVLNAAVFLKDPGQLRKTISELNQMPEVKALSLKAVSWQEASGLIGQLVLVAKGVLYLAILIFFTIALVVINNAMMMATLQRVREIGTMRAIGAQRRFVLTMVLLETLALGIVFAAVGAALGYGAIALINLRGIPANSDELYFFFSGPALFPTVTLANILLAFGIVVVVSAISTFYPAFIATRVSPVEAMQTDE